MADPEGPSTSSELVFYQGEDGRSRIQVRLDGGTVWRSQRLLAELYQVSVPTINEHIKNVYDDEELDPAATIRKFRIVQVEGKRRVSRLIDHYDLDVVLAVGYRVRSPRGTQFRRWATEQLRAYVTKGFVLDDERLAEGQSLGADYFDGVLERIREIRASEKRFYRKISDLYALAVDYGAHPHGHAPRGAAHGGSLERTYAEHGYTSLGAATRAVESWGRMVRADSRLSADFRALVSHHEGQRRRRIAALSHAGNRASAYLPSSGGSPLQTSRAICFVARPIDHLDGLLGGDRAGDRYHLDRSLLV